MSEGHGRTDRGPASSPGSVSGAPLGLFETVRRRQAVVGGIAILTVVVSLLTIPFASQQYTASATVHVSTVITGAGGFDSFLSDRLMATYTEIASSNVVAERAMADLGLSGKPRVEVSGPGGTELLVIEVLHSTPDGAASMANFIANYVADTGRRMTLAGAEVHRDLVESQLAEAEREAEEALENYVSAAQQDPDDSPTVAAAARSFDLAIANYYSLLSGLRSRELSLLARSITVSEPATIPTGPSTPNALLRSVVAAIAGLAIGLGVALKMESSDPLIVSLDDLRALDAGPIVGVLPFDRSLRSVRFLKRGGTDLGSLSLAVSGTPFDQAVVRLYATLTFGGNDSRAAVLMVTSANPSEGKSTVALRLAAVAARSGKRVLVVDANLISPRIHELVLVDNQAGLSQAVEDDDVFGIVQETLLDGLDVVVTGSSSKDPSTAPASVEKVGRLLSYLRIRYDLVVVDTAALSVSADTVVLAPLVDAYLLVVRSGKTGWRAAREALAELDGVRAQRAGTVLNGLLSAK